MLYVSMDTSVCEQKDNISHATLELNRQADRSSWCSAGPLQQQEAACSDLHNPLHDADVAANRMKGINLTLQV